MKQETEIIASLVTERDMTDEYVTYIKLKYGEHEDYFPIADSMPSEILTEIVARIDAKPAQCTWTADEEGVWTTDCGQAFCLEVDGPKENHMSYCCYCGGQLVEKPYEWEEEE